MMDLILGFARRDERVRLVTMEGSRMNPRAPRDRFQDYDICYLVTEMESFLSSDDWLIFFGERIIMQKPEAMSLFPPSSGGNRFAYLMLFEDENRIDLNLVPLAEMGDYFQGADSQTKILLDKDGRGPSLPPPSDRDYWVKKPSAVFVDNCCNEFWWLATYVVKGLCRKELPYSIHHLDLMREQLLSMVSWKAGVETDFSVSMGKSYKYLSNYISPLLWERIKATWRNDNEENVWGSLLLCCEIFKEVSGELENLLGYAHNSYGAKVEAYVKGYAPDRVGPPDPANPSFQCHTGRDNADEKGFVRRKSGSQSLDGSSS